MIMWSNAMQQFCTVNKQKTEKSFQLLQNSRKLCYCKDDRATARCTLYMGALKIFGTP